MVIVCAMSSPVALGTVIDDRYRVDREIGEGGMGVVVQATHLVLNQPVAIKFLRQEAMADNEAVERFIREAQAAAKVRSEHIVRVHDVAATANGTPYLVMEYLEGEVLSSMLASRGALPVREAVRFAIQMCEALAATHAAGIVHGDLKPENIYIAGLGDAPRRVKLLDFGISKIALDASDVDGGGVVMGTPAYMAPEQFRAGTVSTASDIWALGAVLYEMLAGAPPFPGDTLEAIRERVLSARVLPIGRNDVPPGLEDILQRCLQKTARDRWGSAAELATRLETYAPTESTAQRLVGLPPSSASRTSQKLVPTVVLPDRQNRKRYGTWAFAGIGLASVAVVLLLVTMMRRSTRPEPAIDALAPPVAADTSTSATEMTPSPEPSAPKPSDDAVPPTASVATDTAKRTGAGPGPTRRPQRGSRSGPRPAATDSSSSSSPADDGERFGTRK